MRPMNRRLRITSSALKIARQLVKDAYIDGRVDENMGQNLTHITDPKEAWKKSAAKRELDNAVISNRNTGRFVPNSRS